MPKITNTEVYGLERAIKTAKYPMAVDISKLNSDLTPGIKSCFNCPTGEGHDNALNGIIVQFDLTFSIKAWMESERYHFLDFISSQSTMHRLHKFKIAEQCNEYVDQRIINIVQEKVDKYNTIVEQQKTDKNITNQDIKEARLKMLYNIPTGFELTAGMTTNYRQLKTIYQQRRYHALPDWQLFCNWCKSLPRFLELTQQNY